jgi:hypothetical protein
VVHRLLHGRPEEKAVAVCERHDANFRLLTSLWLAREGIPISFQPVSILDDEHP